MAVYSFYRCPRCNKNLEMFVPEGAKGIGQPFRECTKCHSYVIIKDLFNEWELLTDYQKKDMRLRPFKNAIQISGILGFIGGFFVPYKLFNNESLTLGVAFALLFGVIGTYVHYVIIRKTFNEEISKSVERMRDATYRSKLKLLGLINE